MQCWQNEKKESMSLADLPGSLHTNDDTFNECNCALNTHSRQYTVSTKTKHNFFFVNNRRRIEMQ